MKFQIFEKRRPSIVEEAGFATLTTIKYEKKRTNIYIAEPCRTELKASSTAVTL